MSEALSLTALRKESDDSEAGALSDTDSTKSAFPSFRSQSHFFVCCLDRFLNLRFKAVVLIKHHGDVIAGSQDGYDRLLDLFLISSLLPNPAGQPLPPRGLFVFFNRHEVIFSCQFSVFSARCPLKLLFLKGL